MLMFTDSNLNDTGEAEGPPRPQRSDRSRRVGGTRRARRPGAAAHREVSVGRTPGVMCARAASDLPKKICLDGSSTYELFAP